MTPDWPRLHDLVEFSSIELAANDLEPWAELIGALPLPDEDRLWITKLYNGFDDFGSAWTSYRRWPSPAAWASAHDGSDIGGFNCTQERRAMRGGKIVRHYAEYAGHVGTRQDRWLRGVLAGDTPERDYRRLTSHMRCVYGVGRQTAFEWAEFLGKANGFPIRAGDGDLWDSTGPRRSLERLYGRDHPDMAWLDEAANTCRSWMADEGVTLTWEDFETVICDFNVMRDGRYYPGRHLAALREELDAAPEDDRALLNSAWDSIIPDPWRTIPPGIDKTKMPVYRDTGQIRRTP